MTSRCFIIRRSCRRRREPRDPDYLDSRGFVAKPAIAGAGRAPGLIPGDNIVYCHDLEQRRAAASARLEQATVFGYRARDPKRYGGIAFGTDHEALPIEEKPQC
jgi:hypothetical protein